MSQCGGKERKNETSRGPRQRKNLGTLPVSVCKNAISNRSAKMTAYAQREHFQEDRRRLQGKQDDQQATYPQPSG
jgi:hypothetical protein